MKSMIEVIDEVCGENTSDFLLGRWFRIHHETQVGFDAAPAEEQRRFFEDEILNKADIVEFLAGQNHITAEDQRSRCTMVIEVFPLVL